MSHDVLAAMSVDDSSWKKTLRTIVHGVVTTDFKSVQYVFDKYYTEDMVLEHPLFHTKGRKKALQIFEMWSGSNLALRADLHHIGVDEANKTAIVDFTQIYRSKLLGGLFPLYMRIISVVKWRDEADGRKIYYHLDIPEYTTFVIHLPFIGFIYDAFRHIAFYGWTYGYKLLTFFGIYAILVWIGETIGLFLPRTEMQRSRETVLREGGPSLASAE